MNTPDQLHLIFESLKSGMDLALLLEKYERAMKAHWTPSSFFDWWITEMNQ